MRASVRRVDGQPCPVPRRYGGYAADWTIGKLRDAAQRIADRIDELIPGTRPPHETPSQTASRSFAGSTALVQRSGFGNDLSLRDLKTTADCIPQG